MKTFSKFFVPILISVVICAACESNSPREYHRPPAKPMTSTAMKAALNDTNSGIRFFAAEQLIALWSGRLGFLQEELLNADSTVRRAACLGLAKNGTDSALTILRNTCADTNLGFIRRFEAGMALGSAADKLSLNLLKELANGASRASAEYLERSIAQIKDPDSRRPLVEVVRNKPQIRFFLDDIETIRLYKGGSLIVTGGTILRFRKTATSAIQEFGHEHYLAILNHLQSGTAVNYGGEIVEEPIFVISLKGGRHMALIKNGNYFFYFDQWNWLSSGYTLYAPSLAEYIEGL